MLYVVTLQILGGYPLLKDDCFDEIIFKKLYVLKLLVLSLKA
jgi:hypothetical protein